MIRKIRWKYANWKFRKEHTVGKWTYGLPKVWRWGDKSKLIIGKFCSIAPGVEIFLDANHRTDFISTYPFSTFMGSVKCANPHTATKGDVNIGNDVWIGLGAKILSGVTIGDGAVIGAGAVVAKNIPPYAIAVGNPAKVIKFRFCPKDIDILLKAKWWDWPEEKIAKNVDILMSGDVHLFLKRESE